VNGIMYAMVVTLVLFVVHRFQITMSSRDVEMP
jgi:hypothetical protein